MKKKIKTLLVGLGKIGFEYDLNKNKTILTHTKSIIKNKALELVSVVDRDLKKLKRFNKIYNIKTTNNLSKTLVEEKPHLVVISVNTNKLFTTFKKIQKYKSVKYIILEKPGASNYKQLSQIYSICKKNKIKLFLNYNRAYFKNFLAEFGFLKKSKNFKVIYKYSRGLYNNSSHFLNLVFHFLDIPKKILIINKINKNVHDIEADVLLTFKNGKIYLLSSPAKKHIINEGIFFSENLKKKIDMNSSEIIKYVSKKSDLIKNYNLFFKHNSISLPKKNNQLITLKFILKQINAKILNENSVNANLKTLKTLDKIKSKLN